ncbi:MAG TPA: PepSY-associated TM helix domain-containing protein, partial [Isosphaeraceae bacterium]|nr:PepSY-associated TM helix domain-containing protein [Isosphaeraceae bacterium]
MSQPPAHERTLRRRISIRFAAIVRWLHIYLSMFGLAAVLFFSVTGITLNHPDWFYAQAERSVQNEGQINRKWLHLDSPSASSKATADPSSQIAKLEVVEYLRKAHAVRGALADL